MDKVRELAIYKTTLKKWHMGKAILKQPTVVVLAWSGSVQFRESWTRTKN
jgi:hypothetical protein